MKTTKIQRTTQSTQDMDPEYSWLSRSKDEHRGVRTKYCITHNPNTAQPGEDINVNLSSLGSTYAIDPNSINLKFSIAKSETDAKFFNNISANLVQRLVVKIAGNTIYDNCCEGLLRNYTDLWLSQRAREELTEYGLMADASRNVTDKSDAGSKFIGDIFKTKKIPIGKIITDQGVMVPCEMRENFSFTIVLADSDKVLDKGSYILSNIEIEYDSLDFPKLKKEVIRNYNFGKAFPFRKVSCLRQSVWTKDSMLINENIAISLTCLNQIVMLFTKTKRSGSEEFVFPGVNKVDITFKGVPACVYNSGMKTVDLLTEARKTFSGHMNPQHFFCGNRFALCVDLRGSFTPDEYGNGRSTQEGTDIVLAIRRSKEMMGENPEDLNCYIFVVSDAILNLTSKGMTSFYEY